VKTHRFLLLSSAAILGGFGAFGLACSSPSPAFTPDAGNDATTNDSGTNKDSGKDGTPGTDGSLDGGGGCTSPVTGECDIVAQNCSGGNECVLIDDGKGNTSTKCEPAGTGAIPKGGVCNSGGSGNPCVKGTTCVSGRCAPACCEGQDSLCGNSIPEGFTGQCNLNVVDQANKPLYRACSYNAACKPFKVQPCPTDYTCIVEDQSGTATCSKIFQPPGKTEGAACTSKNDCQDGMMCLGNADGGFSCKYTCYKGGGPYFDGGAVPDAAPGAGGCKSPKTCQGGIQQLPTWLGICQ
jgi:hypothetical protein